MRHWIGPLVSRNISVLLALLLSRESARAVILTDAREVALGFVEIDQGYEHFCLCEFWLGLRVAAF